MSLLIQQHGRRTTGFFAKVLEYFQKEFFVLQEKLPFQEKTPIVSFSSLYVSSSDQNNPPANHYHHLPDKRQETFLHNFSIFIQVYLL